MSYYILIYIVSIITFITIGIQILRQYRNIAGICFLSSMIFGSLWFLFYFLFFSGLIPVSSLLLFSRGAFLVGILHIYSLLLFIYSFQTEPAKIHWKYIGYMGGIYSIVSIIYLFTDWIIRDIEISPIDGKYREVYGSLYYIGILLYVGFIGGFLYVSKKKFTELVGLEKIRIQKIIYALYILVLIIVFLQVLLPLFSIWILEKEIIFPYLAVNIYIGFTLRRYYFRSSSYTLGKIVISLVAIILTILLLNSLKYYTEAMNITNTGSYGTGWSDTYNIIDSIISIYLYLILYKGMSRYLIPTTSIESIILKIPKLQKEISKITDMGELNATISEGLQNIFGSYRSYIQLFDKEMSHDNELQHFFSDTGNSVFIRDITFVDEFKEIFNTSKLYGAVPMGVYMVIPMYSSTQINIGGLFVGNKQLGEYYSIDEIKILKEFGFFLELHLKYIRTYTMMHDLSVNLDSRVDDKTIEYNELLNRQKEFIAMVSHEIRSPISAAIFQSDSLIDDIDEGKVEGSIIRDEISLLNKQLVRTGELVTRLFAIQYHDTHDVTLFREKIGFAKFLENEVELFSYVHPDVTVISNIRKNIGFIDIDKIQFQQVINNLLGNAVKYLNADNPTIHISARKKGDNLEMMVADNGEGFQGIDIKNIFDKYAIGNKGKTIGLGMGLYLCKKIISMHNGTIEASSQEGEPGAIFTITIPII